MVTYTQKKHKKCRSLVKLITFLFLRCLLLNDNSINIKKIVLIDIKMINVGLYIINMKNTGKQTINIYQIKGCTLSHNKIMERERED